MEPIEVGSMEATTNARPAHTNPCAIRDATSLRSMVNLAIRTQIFVGDYRSRHALQDAVEKLMEPFTPKLTSDLGSLGRFVAAQLDLLSGIDFVQAYGIPIQLTETGINNMQIEDRARQMILEAAGLESR